MGIFDYWFDSEWRQRDDINSLLGTSEAAAYGVDILQNQMAQIRPMIVELSATVAVLTKMLAEAGLLDPKVVQYRVQAELDERRNPPPPPRRAAEVIPPLRCSNCLREVRPERTIMTENGPVCDPVCPP